MRHGNFLRKQVFTCCRMTPTGSPVLSADRSRLHLEGRFNYEDRDTASVFAGYNFKAGQILQIALTPMIGGVFGNSIGIAPGFSFELNYKSWTDFERRRVFFQRGRKRFQFFLQLVGTCLLTRGLVLVRRSGTANARLQDRFGSPAGSRDGLRKRELYNIRLRHEY